MKRIFITMLAIVMVMLNACSEDEQAKVIAEGQLDFTGDAVSLNGANLYLAYEDNTGSGHVYRNYFITDGIYKAGTTGWQLRHYNDATYLLAVQIAVPEDQKKFTAGNFPLYSSSQDVPDNSNLSWVSFRAGENTPLATPQGTLNGAPVIISGGMEGKATMEFEFTGMLERPNGDDVEGTFYFKGQVKDFRLRN